MYDSRKSFGFVLHTFSATMRASRATNPRPSGLVSLDLAESRPKLRSWRCTQPSAAKTTAGVAVVGNMTSIPRSAAIV